MSFLENNGSLGSSLPSRMEAGSFKFTDANQIEIKNGMIKLPNGKMYKVKVTTKSGAEVLDSRHSDLTQMIIGMLNESQNEENFTYKDLTKTKISEKGISTDQAAKIPVLKTKRIIKPRSFTEDFQMITEIATGMLLKAPESPSRISNGPAIMDPLSGEEEAVLREQGALPESEIVQSMPLEKERKSVATLGRRIPAKALPPIPVERHENTGNSTSSSSNDEDSSSFDDVDLRSGLTLKVNPLEGRVQPFDGIEGSEEEEKAFKEKALEALYAVGEAFKTLGGKIKEGWNTLSAKVKERITKEEGATDSATDDDSDYVISFEPLEGKVKPLAGSLGSSIEGKAFKEKAREALNRVGDGFKYLGGKIKEGWEYISEKVNRLYHAAKQKAFGNEKLESSSQRKSLSLSQIEGGAELHPSIKSMNIFFEEIDTNEAEAAETVDAIVEDKFNWTNVSLANVDRVMSDVIMKKTKAVIKNGKLKAAGRRGFHVSKSQIGTSVQSAEILSQFIGKMHETIILAQMMEPPKVKPSREMVEKILDQFESVESILKSIKDSEWAQAVLANNPVMQKQIETITKKHAELKAVYLAIINDEPWKLLTEQQFNSTLFTPAEVKFRRHFLINYRMYMSTDDLFAKLKEQHRFNVELQQTIQKAEADENGMVTLLFGSDSITVHKESYLHDMKILQSGIIKVCKEWLQDSYINNGEHLAEGSKVPQIVSEILALDRTTKNNKESTLLKVEKMARGDKDAPYLSKVKPSSLNPAHKCDEKDYKGYTDQLILLASGELSKKDRKALLESMAESLFKADAYLLSQISSSELASQSWNKANKEAKSPNLLNMIRAFNKTTGFVQMAVIGMTTVGEGEEDIMLEKRARMIEFFIDLAHLSMEKGNFNSALSISASIQDINVERLKDTWEKVSAKHIKKLEKVNTLADTSKNNKSYRLQLKEFREDPSNRMFIPYLGLMLKDYTFIDDGNPKMKTSESDNRTRYVIPTIQLLGNLLEQIADAQNRILAHRDSKAKEGVNYFEEEHDLLGEINNSADLAYDTLAKVSAVRGESYKKPMTAMFTNLAGGKDLSATLYAESLAIQPKKKAQTQ